MNRFLQWLKSLSEAEKSLAMRPTGLSRRQFLRALGVSAVTVSMGGVAVATRPLAQDVVFNWAEVDLDIQPTWQEILDHTMKHLVECRFAGLQASMPFVVLKEHENR